MTITIRLSPEDERRLLERAAQSGQDVAAYNGRLIEKHLRAPSAVDEVLAPFRRQIEESGMSDDELADFFEDVREDIWREKRAGRSSSR